MHCFLIPCAAFVFDSSKCLQYMCRFLSCVWVTIASLLQFRCGFPNVFILIKHLIHSFSPCFAFIYSHRFIRVFAESLSLPAEQPTDQVYSITIPIISFVLNFNFYSTHCICFSLFILILLFLFHGKRSIQSVIFRSYHITFSLALVIASFSQYMHTHKHNPFYGTHKFLHIMWNLFFSRRRRPTSAAGYKQRDELLEWKRHK